MNQPNRDDNNNGDNAYLLMIAFALIFSGCYLVGTAVVYLVKLLVVIAK